MQEVIAQVHACRSKYVKYTLSILENFPRNSSCTARWILQARENCAGNESTDVESLYGNWLSISIQSWPKVSIIPHKSYIWYPIQTRVPDGFLVMLMLMGFYYFVPHLRACLGEIP